MLTSRLKLGAVIGSLLFFFASPSFAQPVKPGHLKIVFAPGLGKVKGKKKSEEKKEEEDKPQASLKAACEGLGNGFVVKKGLFRHGIVSSYSCFEGDKSLSEKAAKEPDWLLRISKDATGKWQFEMFYQDEKEPQAKLTLPDGENMLAALNDPTVQKTIAAQMMDSLPMSRLIDRESIKARLSYDGRKEETLPQPPVEYKIFSLEYVPGARIWVPKVVGQAKKAKKGKKLVKWDVTLDLELEPGKTYWAQGPLGRGQYGKNFEDTLGKALAKHGIKSDFLSQTVDALYDTLASGYVGLRYGFPMAKGDNLITKAAMVGILTEVRGGPLEGLRWYWDFAPEIKEKVNGQETSYTWSRPTLGWSFGLQLPWFVKRIDVTPKIGVMDFDASFLVETPNGKEARRFRLKNASNFGLELGIESSAPWFLVRFWGASDVSGVVDLGGSGTVTSLRGGIDTVWDFYKISESFDLSFLVFGFGERLTLATNDKEENPTDIKIESVSFNMAFLGAGILLTW